MPPICEQPRKGPSWIGLKTPPVAASVFFPYFHPYLPFLTNILPRISKKPWGEDWPEMIYWYPSYFTLLLRSKFTVMHVKYFQVANNKMKQETLCVETITMICSTLASLWKSQYFQRPIYGPVEDLWWSLYCENIKPFSIFTEKLHRICSHGF